MNADGSPLARGQETFFDFDPWDRRDRNETGESLRFQLVVSDDVHTERKTNFLDCYYGDTVYITLTGSREKGYTIARTDK